MAPLQALLLLSVIVGLFIVLAVASSLWGTDSRPSIGDDHAR